MKLCLPLPTRWYPLGVLSLSVLSVGCWMYLLSAGSGGAAAELLADE